jgi:hypothetical protein
VCCIHQVRLVQAERVWAELVGRVPVQPVAAACSTGELVALHRRQVQQNFERFSRVGGVAVLLFRNHTISLLQACTLIDGRLQTDRRQYTLTSSL